MAEKKFFLKNPVPRDRKKHEPEWLIQPNEKNRSKRGRSWNEGKEKVE